MITQPADIQMILGFSIKTSSKMRTETGCQIWQLDGVTGSHIMRLEAADAKLQQSERKGAVGICKWNAGGVCSPAEQPCVAGRHCWPLSPAAIKEREC